MPDLYRGKLGLEAEEAGHLMRGLDWAGAVADGGCARTGSRLDTLLPPSVALSGATNPVSA